jgi:hypothetical protein
MLPKLAHRYLLMYTSKPPEKCRLAFFSSKFEKKGKRFGGFKEKAYICSG